MKMKLYGDPGSGSLRRVTTAAAIMGVSLERVTIDLFKGESHTAEYLALNPHGLSPVLVDGDVTVWEASAINLHLARKVSSDLVGRTERERTEVLQWMFWSGEQWRVHATLLFDEWAGERFMDRPKRAQIVQLSTDRLRAAAAVLDAHLARRAFIVGDTLTLADIDIAAPFSQSHRTGAPLAEFPHLATWQQRLLDTVPAWAATRDEVERRMTAIVA